MDDDEFDALDQKLKISLELPCFHFPDGVNGDLVIDLADESQINEEKVRLTFRKQLGAGSFGGVYKVTDSDGKVLALKISKPSLTATPGIEQIISNEALLLSTQASRQAVNDTVLRQLQNHQIAIATKLRQQDANTDHYDESSATAKKFREEPKRLRAMPPHPAIVKLEMVGVAAAPSGSVEPLSRYKYHCLVMEFVDGQRIEEAFPAGRTCGQAAFAELLRLFADAASGLASVHDAGYAHRDLSGGNILVTGNAPDRQPRIVDFGNAAEVNYAHDWNTQNQNDPIKEDTQRVRGNQVTAPPDKIRDERSDQWSLGSVLFYLLTSKVANPHYCTPEDYEGPPAPPARLLNVKEFQEVWKLISPVLNRMLAKRKEDRFSDMRIVAAELRGVAAELDPHKASRRSISTLLQNASPEILLRFQERIDTAQDVVKLMLNKISPIVSELQNDKLLTKDKLEFELRGSLQTGLAALKAVKLFDLKNPPSPSHWDWLPERIGEMETRFDPQSTEQPTVLDGLMLDGQDEKIPPNYASNVYLAFIEISETLAEWSVNIDDARKKIRHNESPPAAGTELLDKPGFVRKIIEWLRHA